MEKARKHPDIASRSYYVADNLAEVVMVDFLQMCGQHKTARRCKQCGMLFVPFSSAAKYCDRKSPNGGPPPCKEVAAEVVAKSRTVDPAVALYTKIGNKLNKTAVVPPYRTLPPAPSLQLPAESVRRAAASSDHGLAYCVQRFSNCA